MSDQSQIDALATKFATLSTDLVTAVNTITTEIAALKAANPSIDFTNIDNALTQAQAAVGTAKQLATDNTPVTPTPPATPPTP